VPTELVGAAIFGLASITDWLDGYLARRRKQITMLGQVIDPLADKLLTCAALISLVRWIWWCVDCDGHHRPRIRRHDAAQCRLRARRVDSASPMGKIKMVGEVVAILALILAYGADGLRTPLYWNRPGRALGRDRAALASAVDTFRRLQRPSQPPHRDFEAARELRSEQPEAA